MNSNDYATQADFCAIFRQHLNHLYLSALVLAADEVVAEKCLLAAFDLCTKGGPVFRELALSWSRRNIIKSAIRLISPAPYDGSQCHWIGDCGHLEVDQDESLKCVQELPPFERFVFAISVLERYSDRECALLLGCSYADILPARIRAFQQIARRGEETYGNHSGVMQPCLVDADWLECG
jgi:hypothetical protein